MLKMRKTFQSVSSNAWSEKESKHPVWSWHPPLSPHCWCHMTFLLHVTWEGSLEASRPAWQLPTLDQVSCGFVWPNLQILQARTTQQFTKYCGFSKHPLSSNKDEKAKKSPKQINVTEIITYVSFSTGQSRGTSIPRDGKAKCHSLMNSGDFFAHTSYIFSVGRLETNTPQNLLRASMKQIFKEMKKIFTDS